MRMQQCFFHRGVRTVFCMALAFVLSQLPVRADQTIVVRSGNGVIGSQDSQVRFLYYAAGVDITPKTGDFTTAQAGTFASIVQPCSCYTQTLPADPNAKWIATDAGLRSGSALYAVPFQVTDPAITSASLDLHFAVDNAVNGVFINGQRISGNSYDGDYHAQYEFVRNDIGPLLIPNSTNWLYVNASDYGALAALIFSATIMTSGGGPHVTPSVGGNAGFVSLDILGQSFSLGVNTTVVLHAAGESDIEGIATQTISSSELWVTFDLRGVTPGPRDVVISQEGSPPIIYSGAFTIQPGGEAEVTIDILGPNRIRAGRQGTFDVVVSNKGTVDAPSVSVQAGSTEQSSDSAIQKQLSLTALPQQITPGGCSLPPLTFYLPTGFIRSFSLNCSPQGSTCSNVTATAHKNKTKFSPDCLDEYAAVAKAQSEVTYLQNLINSLNSLISTLQQQYFAQCTPVTASNAAACALLQNQITNAIATRQQTYAQLRQAELDLLFAQAELDACLAQQQKSNSSAVTSKGIATVLSNTNIAVASAASAQASSAPTSQTTTLQFCGVTSVDPNAKLGVSGVGELQYVQGTLPLSYTILFENLPSAGAAAAQVVVTDVLPPGLDFSTVSLSEIRFGATDIPIPPGLSTYSTSVDLTSTLNIYVNVSAQLIGNTLTVTFMSIDPQTGQLVTDLRGFLPPDVNPPAGEGSISFTVMPKRGLSTGTDISNMATVFFDGQPLPTKPWLNKIDNTAPVSGVEALPSQENSASFTVQWQGSDEGSGIQDFTIYVSRDNGTFVPWLINTPALQSTYTAQPGHSYSFYSIGRDATGNIEAAKTEPEATTTLQSGIVGDVNGDGKVNCADIAIVKAAFGTSAGDPKFDVRADVNGDNVVDVRDLAFVAQRVPFGLHCGN